MDNNKQPIRIAQIMGYMNGAGVEAVVTNYYKYIDKNKFQFDFICCEGSTNIPYEEIESQGGKIIIVPSYKKVFSYHKKLKKVLKEGKYKIVHSHINVLSFFSLFAAKKAGVSVRIAHSHSSSNKKEKTRNIIKKILKNFSKIYATDYMCCSEYAGRWLFGNKEYDQNKVYLLNNAIDLDRFKYDEKIREYKRKELGIEGKKLVIGNIGRFVEQKNHRFLIDIFNELHKLEKESILVLAGQGPLEEEIKEKVNELNLNDCVKFLGQRSDANELYQAFDVFLLPSLYEGLPVVGVEAQASGLLCVFSDEMTKETKVLDTSTFMSLNQTSQQWAKSIIDLSKNKIRVDSLEEMTKKGFNIKQEINKLEEYYKNKSKIKVCHVISGLNSGGVESVIYNYCSKMRKDQFEFHVLYQHQAGEKTLRKFLNCGFILKEIPEKAKYPLKNYKSCKKYFKTNSIDVVHCHMTLMNFIPLIAAKKEKIKIRISHSHNNDIRKKNFFEKIVTSLLKKVINITATHFVSCGQDAGKYLYNNEFIILNNAIDIDQFEFNNEIRNEIRNYYNIDSKIIIGHVGRFTAQKNHEFIINIFEKIVSQNDNYRLILVGDGENRHSIENLIKNKGIQNKVILTGNVENVKDYYNAFDIFILPSLWEGLPVVGLEAQANGVPILFSNTIDKSVSINDNVCFLDNDEIKWINEILKIKLNNRENNVKDRFYEKGFLIDAEYLKLENIYKGE